MCMSHLGKVEKPVLFLRARLTHLRSSTTWPIYWPLLTDYLPKKRLFCFIFSLPGTYTDPGGFSGKETATAPAPRDSRCSKDGCCLSRNCGAVFFFSLPSLDGSARARFARLPSSISRVKTLSQMFNEGSNSLSFHVLIKRERKQTRPKRILLYMHGYGLSFSASTHTSNVDSRSLDQGHRA